MTVGPVNPSNGFPDWYRDTNGVDLAPCVDPQDAFCGGAVEAPDNTAPITFPDNFPDEFFYTDASAHGLTSAGGENVLAEFALEGAFGSGPPKAGDQIVFSRIRYRIDTGLKPDTDYKITHPYGTGTVHRPRRDGLLRHAGRRRVARRLRAGPQGPRRPVPRVGPEPQRRDRRPADRLRRRRRDAAQGQGQRARDELRAHPGPGIGGADGAADPNPCPTTGANAYTGPVNDCIQSDNFVLIGKKSTTAGVDVARATYDKTSTSTQIQVLANSKSGQDIVVQDGDNGPGPGRLIRTTPMRGDGGRYMARVDVPDALPTSIDVVNRGDVPTPTTTHIDLTDSVSATAVCHTTKGGGDKVHTTASSSDKTLAGRALTLPGFGNKALDATGQTDIATPAPPDAVTVKSSKGGSVTVPVAIDGEGLDALPLLAKPAPTRRSSRARR